MGSIRRWRATVGLALGLAASAGCLAGPQPEPPTLRPDGGHPGISDAAAPPVDGSADAGGALDAGASTDGGFVDAGVDPGPLVPPRLPPHVEPLPPPGPWTPPLPSPE